MDLEQHPNTKAATASSSIPARPPSTADMNDSTRDSSSSSSIATKTNSIARSYSPGGSSSNKVAPTRSALAHTRSPQAREKESRMVRFAEEPPVGREEAKLQKERANRRSPSPFRRQEGQEADIDSEEAQEEHGPAVERGRTANRIPRRENVSEDSDSWKRRGRSRTPRKPVEAGNGSSART